MRFPGEWEPHERTIMGWPCRRSLWEDTLEQARSDYATGANAIARFEPVTMIANPGEEAAQARDACGQGVEVVELPLDDSWLRDSGPIYVFDGQADERVSRPSEERVAVHFGFNAWGGKFPPWDRDAAVGGLIAQHLGDPVRTAALVLEGGSVLSDGAGTILTTEQCLLHPSRNPTLSKDEIEAALREYLGASRVVWLGDGLVEDRDTDGHVDLIAAYVGAGRLLLQTVDRGNPNFEACEENRRRCEAAGISVIPLPYLPYVEVAGERVAASYLNLYICNGAVIVPVSGAATDEQALAIIAGALPGREVVSVPGAVIAFGGGGPHCITQQVPARRA
jgi:agmatine deiminase